MLHGADAVVCSIRVKQRRRRRHRRVTKCTLCKEILWCWLLVLLVLRVLLDWRNMASIALFIWMCTPTMRRGGGWQRCASVDNGSTVTHMTQHVKWRGAWWCKTFREIIDLWLWLYPITMETFSNYVSPALWMCQLFSSFNRVLAAKIFRLSW